MKPWHSLADLELDSSCGWLDQSGVYYPCEYHGHMDLLDRLQEAGFMPEAKIREIEDVLVKVTMEASGHPIILTYAERITAKQRMVLEKLILKHQLIPEGGYALVGDKEIRMENGKVKFYKL